MGAVNARQGRGPFHIRVLQCAEKMRKQVISARHFPFQRIAEFIRIASQQHQAFRVGKMLGGSLCRLDGCGEMDKAVLQINWCPLRFTTRLKRSPFLFAKDFINQHCFQMARPSVLVKHKANSCGELALNQVVTVEWKALRMYVFWCLLT